MSIGVSWHAGFLWSCIPTCQPRLVLPLGQQNDGVASNGYAAVPPNTFPPFPPKLCLDTVLRYVSVQMLVSNFVLKMLFVYSGKSVFFWNCIFRRVYCFCVCGVFMACSFMCGYRFVVFLCEVLVHLPVSLVMERDRITWRAICCSSGVASYQAFKARGHFPFI